MSVTDRGVAELILSRPEVRNAQNRQMLVELRDLLDGIEADPSIRVVVLGGAGPVFSAGHDLKEAQTRAAYSVEQRWEYEYQLFYGLCIRLLRLRQPTIARVQGHCIAAGLMVAAMCDLMVASEDAVFSDPVVHKLGAAAVEVLFHPWVLGPRLAKEILFTGRSLDAYEAASAGLVNKVVPTEELNDATMELAERIAEAPPFAVQLVKRSINRTLDQQGMANALSAHFDSHMLSHFTAEWHAVVGETISDALKR